MIARYISREAAKKGLPDIRYSPTHSGQKSMLFRQRNESATFQEFSHTVLFGCVLDRRDFLCFFPTLEDHNVA